MASQQQIDQFLSSESFAIIGASSNREKYGNKVLRCYQMNGRNAIPVNPIENEIEGMAVVKSLELLPPEVQSISIITPPRVTEKVVTAAIEQGIKNIWMQPGAQSVKAVDDCKKAGINVIADGSCILVVMGYRED